MGMTLATHSISDANIDLIEKEPECVKQVISPADGNMYECSSVENTAYIPKPNLFTRIFRRGGHKSEPIVRPPEVRVKLSDGENLAEDYDKSWHGIYYCLTKTDWDVDAPLGFIQGGGEELGEDVGYGPVRAYRSAETAALFEKLKGISTEDLLKNYNPAEMTRLDIYPSIWDREDEDNFDYISQNFDLMKAFFKHCVDHKLGFLIYIC